VSCFAFDGVTPSHNNGLLTYYNNITFIGFGSQEGWITTDIKTYITNSKTMSTHQLSDESQKSQSAAKFSAASLVQTVYQIYKM